MPLVKFWLRVSNVVGRLMVKASVSLFGMTIEIDVDIRTDVH